ncbi:hypothetical protein [Pseudoalteromonas byunsanensis]|uniref:3-carboxymuconate cyclase n=1 Tax=Pseudoalteromonas byunsanensis TaxID=327939 RepID=A0A1S1N4V0_9GAMM|nr:hypothetical protein [Pseudoalteromonas byunsanensis]OHU96242.1 hypothetical protein BIW53_06770 [Pseudoalteromonas byunsanensis]
MRVIFGLGITNFIKICCLFGCVVAYANESKVLPVDTGTQYIGFSTISVAGSTVKVFYEIYDADFKHAEVYNANLLNGEPTPQREELNLAKKYNLTALPSFVSNKYLYIVTSQKYWGKNGSVLRVNTENNAIEKVVMPRGLSVGSLLRFKSLTDGKVLATYRAGKSNIFVAKSKDGLNFVGEQSITVGTMPDISSFGDGRLISTYQAGPDLHNMQVYFSILDKSGSVSQPKRIAEHKNIHDAFTLLRSDGNVDVYFVKQAENDERLILSRRCTDHQGNLGVEEVLLDDKKYNVAKPSAQTFNGNEVIVSFINQTGPASSSLHYMKLDGEAPSCEVLTPKAG